MARALLSGVFMVCKAPQRAVNWLQGSVGVEHDLMPPSAAGLVERILLHEHLVKSSDHFQATVLANSISPILVLEGGSGNDCGLGECLCGVRMFSTGSPQVLQVPPTVKHMHIRLIGDPPGVH